MPKPTKAKKTIKPVPTHKSEAAERAVGGAADCGD